MDIIILFNFKFATKNIAVSPLLHINEELWNRGDIFISFLRLGFKSWKIFIMKSFIKVLAYNNSSKIIKNKTFKIRVFKKK